MERRRTVYILILFITIAAPSFAGKCKIEILNEKNSGEKIRFNFNSNLKSQKQCQMLANMHRPNFNPNQVKSKTVSYQWFGSSLKSKSSNKKHSSEIAKTTQKKRRRLKKHF